MKRVLKIISGFAVVAALACVMETSAQARTFVSVNLGFGGYPAYDSVSFSSGNYRPQAYARPSYYCPPQQVYYCPPQPVCPPQRVYYCPPQPVYRYDCAPPVYHYYGRSYYCR